MKKIKLIIKKILRLVKKLFRFAKRIARGVIYRIPSYFKSIIKKFKKPSKNMQFYNKIDELIEKIPSSNGSNYYKKAELTIGIITDEYMFNYYKDAVNLKYIAYNEYKETVKDIDMLLFISCWRGMRNNDWRGMSSEAGRDRVIEVMKYARKLGKKVIFQTIEDPSNYEVYISIAKAADYIFTTDNDMVDRYKKDTKNKNVYLLDYGINPQFHNPVGLMNREKRGKSDVFFAGSWAPRYVERCEDTKMLFDGVINSKNKFVLADRNYYIKGYEFPTKYSDYIVPPIDHTKLQKVHKLFNWSINLNSIKYSPTMCAMRVYELQAIGNLMISNYSIAVNNQFPNIFMAKTSNEVASILNSYDELSIYEMQTEGIRNVMSHHTVYDKLNYIFDKIDEKKHIIKDKNILIVCDKINNKIREIFEKQTYKNKEIIEKKKVTKEIIKKYNYIAFMNSDYNYKKHYLEDLINGFKYTDSDFITIASSIDKNQIKGINHDYLNETNNIYLSVIDSKRLDYFKIAKENKIIGKGYSIDPFQITDIKISTNTPKELSVIVPIYNNGKFLLSKCFNSLLRSSIFKKMEIILVDDGSTDKNTIDIIKTINNKYDNIKTYFFDDGGSGSASRPRNKGVELTSTKYITYLDPDNEAINDGYAKLLSIIQKGDYDFVFGSVIKLASNERTLSYYGSNQEINNPKEELIKKDFKTNSIQACVIKKELIEKNKIKNPVGAAGQDSLFFQELMYNAKKVYYLNLPIHIYYAARNDSIVNSISHKFFEKFLIMEKYQVIKLKEYGIFEEYCNRRYHQFLENWYYEKLKYAADKKEEKLSKEIICEIRKLYGDID